MSQFARPDSDISNTGAWTTAPLWQSLDDNDDTDFVISPAGAAGSNYQFEVGLSNVSPPGSGTVTVRGRFADNNTDTANTVDWGLYQGTTAIATGSIPAASIGVTFSTFSITLGAPQVASITDWTDLRIRVEVHRISGVNRAEKCAWVELQTPDAAVSAFNGWGTEI